MARGVGGKAQGSDARWSLVDGGTRLVESPGWTAGAAASAAVAPLAPGAPLRLDSEVGRPTCNVCLSSGFLAFAAHAGFLAAVEAAGYQASTTFIIDLQWHCLAATAASGVPPKHRLALDRQIHRLTHLRNVFQVVSVMGTSAGAITGSLYSTGMSPYQVAEELSRFPPKAYLVRCGSLRREAE